MTSCSCSEGALLRPCIQAAMKSRHCTPSTAMALQSYHLPLPWSCMGIHRSHRQRSSLRQSSHTEFSLHRPDSVVATSIQGTRLHSRWQEELSHLQVLNKTFNDQVDQPSFP